MESNIKFVREYDMYRERLTDTKYESGRVVTRYGEPPKTVKAFIANAIFRTRQYDNTFKRWETIYHN